MNSEDLSSQVADLHEYLVKTIGHKWRLATWKKNYIARLRTYGFDKAIIAIDGFHSMKWWMDMKSQDAPDCIFRSDKAFERFLASGMALSQHDQAARKLDRKESERTSILAEIRARLECDNAAQTVRMHEKLAPLREEMNENSWTTFIAPLLYVKFERGTVIIFSEAALWVNDHYADRIAATLGAPVKITSEP